MRAIVIGSGIAGLASAIRLVKKGYEVQVFESNSYAGGKLHAIKEAGYRFDMGPSLFTMPHLVDELYTLHDMDPREHFNYHQKHIVCNYFWEDGLRFSVTAQEDEFIEKAAETFDVNASTLKKYLQKNKKKIRPDSGYISQPIAA